MLLVQTNQSSLAEMTNAFHKANHSTIHINPSSIPSGIDRGKFNILREKYWKDRALSYKMTSKSDSSVSKFKGP